MCFQSFILCLRHFLKCAEERSRFNPWVRKIPWSRKWQPTPVFLPGEFHGQRSLLGYRQQGGKESDMTEYARGKEVSYNSEKLRNISTNQKVCKSAKGQFWGTRDISIFSPILNWQIRNFTYFNLLSDCNKLVVKTLLFRAVDTLK